MKNVFFKSIYFISFLLIYLFLGCTNEEQYSRVIKVGFYENPPKVYMDDRGKARGIFIDLIELIAQEEHWKIEYHQASWNELLEMLQSGEIDLMVDVAFTQARDEIFDFNQLAVLSSWIQLYTRSDTIISTMDQLRGKPIALLSGSSQVGYIYELDQQFNLNLSILEKGSYIETIHAVEQGEAFGVFADRFFEFSDEKGTLVATPIILRPSDLYCAVKQGENRDLLLAIDKHISDLLNFQNAVYQKIINNNIEVLEKKGQPDSYRFYLLLILLLSLIILLLYIFLRREIGMKRAEIETQNLRMEQVQKMNLLGQLSGEIAHDFNNILCGIMGYTDLMLENKPDEENRKMLNSILEASLRGEHLIQQILLFGRKKEIKLIEGKLGLVVQDVFSFIRPSFPPSVEIILKLEKEESSILLEPYKIHECLLNICTNSLHAMDKKGVLTIQLKHHEIKSRELGLLGSLKKGDYRVIEVSDTGRGIPQDQLSKIFEPYFTTKDIGEGTGLGLSVVYGVMEQHGGNIKIHSAVGEGSTITLFFPL